MKTNRKLNIILILLQIIPIIESRSCKCPYLHPQARFCLTGTVVLGKYMGSISGQFHLFDVHIVYKPTEPLLIHIGNITVITPWGCGFPAQKKNHVTLLFGHLKGRRMSSKVCAEWQFWEKRTDFTLGGFLSYGKEDCDCMITEYYSKKNYASLRNSCLGQHAYLQFKDGKCQWKYEKEKYKVSC